MPTFVWETDINAFYQRLLGSASSFGTALAEGLSSEVAPQLVEYATANHPWQNQTGMLEAAIEAGATVEVDSPEKATVTMWLGYNKQAVSDKGFDYGSKLEADGAGEWSVLVPTQRAVGIPAAMEKIKQTKVVI